jgi:putative DNA primase/helicase
MSTLRIPVITEDMDVLMAALAYAKHGWYVIPVKADTKAPTVLGKDWPSLSSRDPQVITSWFAGTDHALGLHVGRSGAVAFDVDIPDLMPEPLKQAILDCAPPYQSTREDELNRGHYLFLTDRRLGNGRGKLLHPDHGGKWGEVRGSNGIIVVEPSHHSKAVEGGQYVWIPEQFGDDDSVVVPAMPHYLDALLPDGTKTETAATDAEVTRILRVYLGETKPQALRTILDSYREELRSGSRHEATTKTLPWALREAIAGFFPAKTAVDTMRSMFLEAPGPHKNRADEFDNILAWSVGQVTTVDGKQIAQDVESRLASHTLSRGTEDDFFGGADDKEVAEAAFAEADKAPSLPKFRDTSDYFPYDADTRRSEFDPILLANDILRIGPLAIGRDHRFWAYENGVWREDEFVVRGRAVALLRRRYRPNHRTVTEDVLKHHPHLAKIDADPVEDYINFTNGMLDWRKGTLHPHSPKYLSTIQIPFAWDPDATCPQFTDWIGGDDGILSKDYAELMWQIIGYLLMSGNPLQVAVLFLGKGRNGKGTLMRVLKNLLGGDNISAIDLNDLNESRFAAASLYGKTANLAGDIDATFQEATARFKKLTGEDVYQAENKGQNPFRFKNWAVPVFSANKIPGSADTSEGYTRRWIIVKFEKMITEQQQILHLDERFRAELPGIAVKAIEALRPLMAAGHFKNDGDIAVGKAEFVEEIDQVRQFVSQWCEQDPTGGDERTALYASYKMWSDKNGMGKLSAKEFYHRLENAGFPAVKVNGVRRHRGVRVKVVPVVGDFFEAQQPSES